VPGQTNKYFGQRPDYKKMRLPDTDISGKVLVILENSLMKNITLHIDYETKPEKLAGSLKSQKPDRGDKLIVNSVLNEELTLIILLSILYFWNEGKMQYANEVLKDIFSTKGNKEIQDEIAKEYGIEIEIKSSAEKNEWLRFSREKLAGAYGDREPDYDMNMVKEPNPDYKQK